MTTPNRATLALAVDPTHPVVFGTSMPQGYDDVLDGALRHYAGSRNRAVVFDQADVSYPVTLRHLSPTDLGKVRAWRGRVVIFTAADGYVVTGVYFATTVRRLYNTTPDDGVGTVTYDVDIALANVSYTP